MTTKDRLIAGRNRIEDPKNWGQGLRRDHTMCVMEAVRSQEAWTVLRKALGLGLQGSLTRWNDDPSRTHAEVLAAIDAAIALA
jgi:hypothetical protein